MPKTREYTLQVHAFHDCGKHALVGVETEYGPLWGSSDQDLARRIRFMLGHEPVFSARRLTTTHVPSLTLAYLRQTVN